MRIVIFACLMLVFVFPGFAQGGGDLRKDINIAAGSLFYMVDGKPVVTGNIFKIVEGSNFFNENWMKAILVLNNGAEYKNINTRLDLLTGDVYYQDQFGAEFIAKQNIKEVILIDTVADINYRFVNASVITDKINSKNPQWYQWLCSGKASVYK